jgi:lycopene cyclase domain-containing protein
MTYFGFLIRFLVLPILVLGTIAVYDQRRGRSIPVRLHASSLWLAIPLHMFIAIAYTTLWDNYLVATRVWWYDPELVTGITIGWVPIEEYIFFILQPLLAGLWLVFLLRRIPFKSNPDRLRARHRWLPLAGVAGIWVVSLITLITGWSPGTYISLELVWALPPIALQLAFGGDILFRYRKLVLLTIIPLTIYLSAADSLAINLGTWTINPEKSLEIYLGGILPLEEFLFFLLTNTLVVFGTVLILADDSWIRFREISGWIRKTRAKQVKISKE